MFRVRCAHDTRSRHVAPGHAAQARTRTRYVITMSDCFQPNVKCHQPTPQNAGASEPGMFLTRTENAFLIKLGECVRGERAFSDEELWASASACGFKNRREMMFIAESFKEGGDVLEKFTPREIGMLMRKRHISRFMEWGWHEGLCDGGRMSDDEFQTWLTGMIRDTSLDFKERKWAAETWLRLRGQDVKKSTAEASGGAKVQIVISNPYGGGSVNGGAVEVKAVSGNSEVGNVVSGSEVKSLNEDSEC